MPQSHQLKCLLLLLSLSFTTLLSLKHTKVCEDGRKARKKKINTRTKQRSRLTSKVANFINEYESFESEKHSDDDVVAGRELFVMRQKAIMQKCQIHKALNPLIYKSRGALVKPSFQSIQATTVEASNNHSDGGDMEIPQVTVSPI